MQIYRARILFGDEIKPNGHHISSMSAPYEEIVTKLSMQNERSALMKDMPENWAKFVHGQPKKTAADSHSSATPHPQSIRHRGIS